ncbi:MAG: ABC transporter permease subunit [Bradymonadales bacterium]|nr:ABC transporter permease subunit [Bradymonadales bacterium]
MGSRGSTQLERIFKHALLIFAVIVTMFPVIFVLKLAFSGQQQLNIGLVPWPDDFSLGNFADFTTRKTAEGVTLFPRQLFNSVVVATCTTLFGIFLATTAAYALSRFRFPGRKPALFMFLVSQMFPGTLMLIPIYVILDRLHLLNNLLGLILVYSTTAIPFCVWMLKGYFDTIPLDLEESARIDGASPIVIFYKIILPLARPAIAVTALFSFMTGWNEFILAATFMDKEVSYTLPVALQRYVGEYGGSWGSFAAGSIIVSVPVVLLFYFLQRNLVSGLMAGSVKG